MNMGTFHHSSADTAPASASASAPGPSLVQRPGENMLGPNASLSSAPIKKKSKKILVDKESDVMSSKSKGSPPVRLALAPWQRGNSGKKGQRKKRFRVDDSTSASQPKTKFAAAAGSTKIRSVERQQDSQEDDQPPPVPQVDVLYLQADPFQMAKTDEGEVYSAVDFGAALESFVSSLQYDNGRCVRYRTGVATTENLRAAITNGCRVLHLRMHGVARSTVAAMWQSQQAQSASAVVASRSTQERSALLFEDDCGEPHYLHATDLLKLMSAGQSGAPSSMQLAFVASCHSQDACQVLLDAGFEHVIGIDVNSTIDMEACCQFERQLYKSLFSGRSVSQSFEIGLSTVKVGKYHQEAPKFRLLPQDENHDHSKVLFPASGVGSVQVGRPIPIGPQLPCALMFSRFPALPARCVPRSSSVHRLVNELRGHRLVLLSGPGSSTIANLATRHLRMRDNRLEVCWVSMKGLVWDPYRYNAYEDTSLQPQIRLAQEYPAVNFLFVFDNAHYTNHRDFLRSGSSLSTLVQLSNARVLATYALQPPSQLHQAEFRCTLPPPGPLLFAWMFWRWLPAVTKVPPMPTSEQWRAGDHGGFPGVIWQASGPAGQGDRLMACITALSHHPLLRTMYQLMCKAIMGIWQAVQIAHKTSDHTLDELERNLRSSYPRASYRIGQKFLAHFG